MLAWTQTIATLVLKGTGRKTNPKWNSDSHTLYRNRNEILGNPTNVSYQTWAYQTIFEMGTKFKIAQKVR